MPPPQIGGSCGTGAVGRSLSFLMYNIHWVILSTGETNRKTGLSFATERCGGLSILSSGISLGHPKASQLDRFCAIAKLSCPDPKEPGRRYRI